MKIYKVAKEYIVKAYQAGTAVNEQLTSTHTLKTTKGKDCGKRIGAGTQYLVFQYGAKSCTLAPSRQSHRARYKAPTAQKIIELLGAPEIVVIPQDISSILNQYTVLDSRRAIFVVPNTEQPQQSPSTEAASQQDIWDYIYLRARGEWYILTLKGMLCTNMALWVANQRKLSHCVVSAKMSKKLSMLAILYKGKLYFSNNGSGAPKNAQKQALPEQLFALIPRFHTWVRLPQLQQGQRVFDIQLTDEQRRVALTIAGAQQLGRRVTEHIMTTAESAMQSITLYDKAQDNNVQEYTTDEEKTMTKSTEVRTAKKIVVPMPATVYMGSPDTAENTIAQYEIGATGNRLVITRATQGVYEYALYLQLQNWLSLRQSMYAVSRLLDKVQEPITMQHRHDIFVGVSVHLAQEYADGKRK